MKIDNLFEKLDIWQNNEFFYCIYIFGIHWQSIGTLFANEVIDFFI